MVQPRRNPRQQRSRRTVDAILEAAAHLFARDGYTETTTNHIALRAHVSIGSLYQYFPNKDALLLALAERHLDDATETLLPVFERLRETGAALEELLRTLVEQVAALHRDRPGLHRLFFDHAPRDPAVMARFRATERAFAAALAAELRRLGVGGSDPELDALLAVEGIEAQIHGAVLDRPDGLDEQHYLDAIVALWCRALDHPAATSTASG